MAMGASHATYTGLASSAGDRRKVADETWAINSMGTVIEHDLLFHMDDVKIQEARAERNPEGNIAGLVNWLHKHPKFMTSRAYPDYPGAVEFPLQDVVNKLGYAYFNSTVAYAVAYAIYLGVKKISLYGVDYSYENGHKAEKGRACVEYYLGMASAMGIHVEVACDSTLMDAKTHERDRFYGYDTEKLTMIQTDDGVRIDREPLSSGAIPTALDMEVRYCHEVKTSA